MFAHRIVDFTGPAAVHWTQVEEPAAEGGVVIDVIAAGVSFADLLQTTGAYQLQLPLPFTPGMDAAGVVRPARPRPGRRPTGRRPDFLRLLAGGHQRPARARADLARRPELGGRRGPPPQLPDRPAGPGPPGPHPARRNPAGPRGSRRRRDGHH